MLMSWPQTTENTNVLLMTQGFRNDLSFYSWPQKQINYIEVMIYSLEMTVTLKWKKFLGSGTKRRVTSESVGHKENVGVLCCFGSWHYHRILTDPMYRWTQKLARRQGLVQTQWWNETKKFSIKFGCPHLHSSISTYFAKLLNSGQKFECRTSYF